MLKTLLKVIPSHRIYVELIDDSAKLLFNKDPVKIEVYNDYSKQLANLFYVATFRFEEFVGAVNKLSYSDDTCNYKVEELGDIESAVKTYYKLLNTFSSRLSSKSSLITVTQDFFNGINGLSHIHMRLKNVIIECSDFRKLLKRYKDVEDAFIYADLSYLGEQDYKDMLDLKGIKGKWLITGYSNPLLDSELKDYYRLEIPKSNPEILWANYNIKEMLDE
jgi:site-specific DNA-adenine methylase